MLNLQEFQEYVQMNLKDSLPEEYRDITIDMNQVQKNNGLELHAVIVKGKDSNIAPQIYMEGFFQEYQEGTEMDVILNKIGKIAMEYVEPPQELRAIAEDFQDFDYVKDRVVMAVVNAEKNQELLSDVPFQPREDLAIIYKVMTAGNSEGIATITIHNSHMEFWDTTVEQLHEFAVENTKTLLPITTQSMTEVMREMFAEDGMPEEMLESMFAEAPVNERMYVISNQQRVNGAVGMFDEHALSELAKQVGTDLFILPSSVHECIAVSTEMGTPETLAEMVQEINGTQVAIEEQLSDHVYRFDAKAKTISLADTTMEQLQSKVSEQTQGYETEASNKEATSKEVTNTEAARPRHHR